MGSAGTAMNRRWTFGDQLGPHFLGSDAEPGDDGSQPVLMVESRQAFLRRRYHRAKAHLILSAMRHRADELGERCEYVRVEGYRDAIGQRGAALTVVDPTSYAARRLVRDLGCTILPARGFMTSQADFATWAEGRKQLRLEDFYRDARRRTGILMRGGEPAGDRWNFDADNRLPPPRGASSLGLPSPVWPVEDDIDAGVREDLAAWEREGIEFIGDHGPRTFAVFIFQF